MPQKQLNKKLSLFFTLFTITVFAVEISKGPSATIITTGSNTAHDQPLSQSVENLSINGNLVVEGTATIVGGINGSVVLDNGATITGGPINLNANGSHFATTIGSCGGSLVTISAAPIVSPNPSILLGNCGERVQIGMPNPITFAGAYIDIRGNAMTANGNGGAINVDADSNGTGTAGVILIHAQGGDGTTGTGGVIDISSAGAIAGTVDINNHFSNTSISTTNIGPLTPSNMNANTAVNINAGEVGGVSINAIAIATKTQIGNSGFTSPITLDSGSGSLSLNHSAGDTGAINIGNANAGTITLTLKNPAVLGNLIANNVFSTAPSSSFFNVMIDNSGDIVKSTVASNAVGTTLGTCSPLTSTVTIDATNINIGQCSPAVSETININALNSTTGPVNIGSTAGHNAITVHTGTSALNINQAAGDTGILTIGNSTGSTSVNIIAGSTGGVSINNTAASKTQIGLASVGSPVTIDSGSGQFRLNSVNGDTGGVIIGHIGESSPITLHSGFGLLDINPGPFDSGGVQIGNSVSSPTTIDTGFSAFTLNNLIADTGGVQIGHGTGASPITLDSGTSTLKINNNINDTGGVQIGIATAASPITLDSGTSTLKINNNINDTGGVQIGHGTVASPITLDSGTSTLKINNNINDTGGVQIGIATGASPITLDSGTSTLKINNNINDTGGVQIGIATAASPITLDSGTSTLKINNNINDTGGVQIGIATAAIPVTIDSGSGVLNLNSAAGNTGGVQIGLASAAASPITLDSGSDLININTNTLDTGNVVIGNGGGMIVGNSSSILIQTPGEPSALTLFATGNTLSQNGGSIKIATNANGVGAGSGGSITLQSLNTALTPTPSNAIITLDVSGTFPNKSGSIIFKVGDTSPGHLTGGNFFIEGLQESPASYPYYLEYDGSSGSDTGRVIATPIAVSSRRFKKNVLPLSADETSQIYRLNPVEFQYKWDADKIKEYGLIAEDLLHDNILTEAVRYGEDGLPMKIRYRMIFMALLNEFIKHKADYEALKMLVLELQNTIVNLKQQIACT